MDMLPIMCCTLVSNSRDQHDKNWWIITSSVCFTGNICHCITLHYLATWCIKAWCAFCKEFNCQEFGCFFIQLIGKLHYLVM